MQESVQGPGGGEGRERATYCDTVLYVTVLFVSCTYLLCVGREGVVFAAIYQRCM